MRTGANKFLDHGVHGLQPRDDRAHHLSKQEPQKLVTLPVGEDLSVPRFGIPVGRLVELSERQRPAEWVHELLRLEMIEIEAADFDTARTGLDDSEIRKLLGGADEETEGLDDAPVPPKDPISRPGDLYICGKHRVRCGDATVLADIEARSTASSPTCEFSCGLALPLRRGRGFLHGFATDPVREGGAQSRPR